MASKMRFILGFGVGSLTLFLTGVTFAQETGFYLNADIGPAWREQVNVKRFLNIPNPGRLGFDTGVRLDLGVGYQFMPWLAAEFETGVIHNNFEGEDDLSLQNYPLMFNVVVKTQLWNRLTPFAGVGVGGVVSTLWADDAVIVDRNRTILLDGQDSDFVFGWQGFIGARYSLNDQWDISLTYRYLWADDSSWEVRTRRNLFGPRGTDRIEIGSTETHAVVLGATFRF